MQLLALLADPRSGREPWQSVQAFREGISTSLVRVLCAAAWHDWHSRFRCGPCEKLACSIHRVGMAGFVAPSFPALRWTS